MNKKNKLGPELKGVSTVDESIPEYTIYIFSHILLYVGVFLIAGAIFKVGMVEYQRVLIGLFGAISFVTGICGLRKLLYMGVKK